MTKRYKKWKKWRRRNTNGKFYQLLVLIGFVYSPSFYFGIAKFTYFIIREWEKFSTNYIRKKPRL